MIVVWISHKNRKARRAAMARARQNGLPVLFVRAETDVHGQTSRLLAYLVNPDPHNIAALLEYGDAPPKLLAYMTGVKTPHAGATNVDLAPQVEAGREIDDDGDDDEAAGIEVLDAALSDLKHQPKVERVLQVAARNLFTETVEDRQLEMALVADLAPGLNTPVEHLVISWPDNVAPTSEQVESLLDLQMRIWRMERHQAFAAVHGDTDHVHIHIAINRVDPLTGERVSFGGDEAWALETLHQAIAVAAHQFDWPTAKNARYRADQSGCYDQASNKRVLDDRLEPCASKSDWRRINELRKREERDRAISSAARRYELRTGYISLERIAREQLAELFKDSVNWQGLHAELALRGIEYVRSPSGKGAQLVFGSRAIPASTAWGGASLDKLTRQIGSPFEPRTPEIELAPFVEQENAGLRSAILRRAELAAMKSSAELEQRVAAEVDKSIALAHAEERAKIDRLNWVGRRDKLNAKRAAAAVKFRNAREALAAQAKRRRQADKLRRRLLKQNALGARFADFGKADESVGLLLGPRFGEGKSVKDELSHHLQRIDLNDRSEYRRASRLVFVDRRNFIEIHAPRDMEALRAAMRLAAMKWGSVQATGNAELLSALVDISIDENITLTNAALQPLIAQRRREREERDAMRRAVEEARLASIIVAPPIDEKPTTGVAGAPAFPLQYPEQFHRWALLDRTGSRAADAEAARIVAEATLAEALAELRAQGYPQAIRIAAGAQRYQRSMPNSVVDTAAASTMTARSVDPEQATLAEVLAAEGRREKAERTRIDQALWKATHTRAGRKGAKFEGNATALLRGIASQPGNFHSIKNPPGVGTRAGQFSGLSDELQVMSFDSAWMARAHQLLEDVRNYSGVGTAPAVRRLPVSANLHSQADFVATAALSTTVPAMIDKRPGIAKYRHGYMFADAALVETMGEDAVCLLTGGGQQQLKAAYLLQQIDRNDLLDAISESRASLSYQVGPNRVLNRLVTADTRLQHTVLRFASDASFTADAATAVVTPRSPADIDRRHALLRAYSAAADQGDWRTGLAICGMIERNPDKIEILRQVSHEDVKRLYSDNRANRELLRMWNETQGCKPKPARSTKIKSQHAARSGADPAWQS